MFFSCRNQRTKVVKKTLNPVWDQTLVFKGLRIYGTPETVSANPPPVVVQVYDHDLWVRNPLCSAKRNDTNFTLTDRRTCCFSKYRSLIKLLRCQTKEVNDLDQTAVTMVTGNVAETLWCSIT